MQFASVDVFSTDRDFSVLHSGLRFRSFYHRAVEDVSKREWLSIGIGTELKAVRIYCDLNRIRIGLVRRPELIYINGAFYPKEPFGHTRLLLTPNLECSVKARNWPDLLAELL